jgi:hypothetical protein
MMPMLHHLALLLVLADAPSVLSAEATEHNTRAMRFYDAGQLAPAVDEFHAAYQSMPDARRDLAGREQLLGSMRATLLALHARPARQRPCVACRASCRSTPTPWRPRIRTTWTCSRRAAPGRATTK